MHASTILVPAFVANANDRSHQKLVVVLKSSTFWSKSSELLLCARKHNDCNPDHFCLGKSEYELINGMLLPASIEHFEHILNKFAHGEDLYY